MRGCASGRARYVVRGVCVLVVRVAFQCVYLCLRACACLMLRRGVVAVRIWPESCWSMGCERMGVLFGLFRTLLMPLLLMTCGFDGFGAVVSGWGYDSGCFGLF